MRNSSSLLPTRRVAESKIRLLEAGVRLFTRNAGEGVTVRELAREAKVNSALVSYHYGGLAELMDAVVDRCIQDLRGMFIPLVENFEKQMQDAAPENIPPLLREHVEALLGILAGPKGMALLRALGSPESGSLRGVYSRFTESVLQPLHHSFAAAVAGARGIPPESLEAAVLAQCMIAQCMAFFRGARPVLALTGKESFTSDDKREISRLVAEALCRTAGVEP